MRSREEDANFLEEFRTRMDVVLHEVEDLGAGRVTIDETSSLVAWVKKQEYPLKGEKLAPISPGDKGCFHDSGVDRTTLRLLDGAMFVDGGGRGLVPMKARAEGDCLLVSVAGLAFGGRCSSVAEAERYALPLRAAAVHHAMVHMEEVLKTNFSYSQPAFYDASVWYAVSGMGETEKYCSSDGSFQRDLARVFFIVLLRSIAKELTPCPPAFLPLLANALGTPIRTYHPGLTLGSVGASRNIITPLNGCKRKDALPLLVAYTLSTPEGDLRPPHPFDSLYEYKERCFTELRKDSRGYPLPGTGYSYYEFTHFVPILPPRDLLAQMEQEARYLREGSQGCPEAHVLSKRSKKLIAKQAARDAEAELEKTRLETEEQKRAEQAKRVAATERAAGDAKTKKVTAAKKVGEARLLAEGASRERQGEEHIRKEQDRAGYLKSVVAKKTAKEEEGKKKAVAAAEAAKMPPVMPRKERLAQEKAAKAKKDEEDFSQVVAAEKARGARMTAKQRREAATKEATEIKAAEKKARKARRNTQNTEKAMDEAAASTSAASPENADPTETANGSIATSAVPVRAAGPEHHQDSEIAAFAEAASTAAAAGARNLETRRRVREPAEVEPNMDRDEADKEESRDVGPKRSITVFSTALCAMCCVGLSPAVATVATAATTAAVTAVVATAVVRDLRSAFHNRGHKKDESL